MHFDIQNITFIIVLAIAIYLFTCSFNKIWRNIKLGKNINRSDRKKERWFLMTRVALGQSKMIKYRVIAGFFHLLIYIGFLLINIEVAEILIDGIFGTHRTFAKALGPIYNASINFFEILAVLVILACVVFLCRRNIKVVSRFKELEGWPQKDGNNILLIEIVLMIALLILGAAEANMKDKVSGPWVISSILAPVFSGLSQDSLHLVERIAWWAHVLGILAFLNYIPFSKHLHIILAFPNVWYSKLGPKGKLINMESVKKEVETMMNPNTDLDEGGIVPERFGAKDVMDLNWVQLMNAYSCTECGRCTAVCPANLTGKKLSPRKIMMDTRDRLEEVSKNIDVNKGEFREDGKALLDNYISSEELWACTTCNACTEACPVNIDPLSIIVDMRRYLVMEEPSASQQINMMMANVENNGAPWACAQADRANWINE